MTKQITAEQYAELKSEAYSVEVERDVEFSYESLFDHAGNEIGFAAFRGGEAVSFTQREAQA